MDTIQRGRLAGLLPFFAAITCLFIAKEVIDMKIVNKLNDQLKKKRRYGLCLRNEAIFNVGVITALGLIGKENRKILDANDTYIKIELIMDVEQKAAIDLATRDYQREHGGLVEITEEVESKQTKLIVCR